MTEIGVIPTDPLEKQIQGIYGADLSFDASWGVQEVNEASGGTDFAYQQNPAALAEELERLFTLTPKGSLVDDPSYGVDFGMLGDAILDVHLTESIVKMAVLDALNHPSFKNRFQPAAIEVEWRPEQPNAVQVTGILEVFGFEGAYFKFGPYSLEI